MSLSKLKQIHIVIIGSFLCVAAGAALFFLMIKPQMEALKAAQGRVDAAAPTGTQSAVDRAARAVQDAQAKVAELQDTLDKRMKEKMPDLSFEQRERGMMAFWQEQKAMQSLLNNFARRDKNVASVQADFVLPTPPWNPNDPFFDQEQIVMPLGQVSAVGDFPTLMNNIRRWNNCNRLVMVNAPTLQMGETGLQMQYSVTCYVFPVTKGGAPVPMAGAAGPGDPNAAMGGGAPVPQPMQPQPMPQGGAAGEPAPMPRTAQ